jgi:uncharacterized protein
MYKKADPMSDIIVRKLNLEERETWRYSGEIILQDDEKVILEALFNRDDLPFNGILLRRGDRFLETFFLKRWYNIFEMHDREDDTIKGWYCNICYPAKMEGQTLSYVDLALDVLIYPDGRQLILDEDEFEALKLAPDIRSEALAALELLKQGQQEC